jgi:hypothetical protein
MKELTKIFSEFAKLEADIIIAGEELNAYHADCYDLISKAHEKKRIALEKKYNKTFEEVEELFVEQLGRRIARKTFDKLVDHHIGDHPLVKY